MFGLNMYTARKTFKWSVVKNVNFMISPCRILPTGENGWRHSGGLIVMVFWTGLGWTLQTKSITIVNISILFIHMFIYFLTKHNTIIVLLHRRKLISRVRLSLFGVILKRSGLENAWVHLVSYKLRFDKKSIHY